MDREFMVVNWGHGPMVIAEYSDDSVARGSEPTDSFIGTREEIQMRFPQALAAWELGDDSSHETYLDEFSVPVGRN